MASLCKTTTLEKDAPSSRPMEPWARVQVWLLEKWLDFSPCFFSLDAENERNKEGGRKRQMVRERETVLSSLLDYGLLKGKDCVSLSPYSLAECLAHSSTLHILTNWTTDIKRLCQVALYVAGSWKWRESQRRIVGKWRKICVENPARTGRLSWVASQHCSECQELL